MLPSARLSAPNTRLLPLLATLLLTSLTSSGWAATPTDGDRAAAAVQDLGTRLRTALVAKISSEGPVAAIDFCQSEAPLIAASVGGQHGVRIGRTSLKVRNAANAPQDWQQSVLVSFAAQTAAGTPPSALRFRATTGLPPGVSLRYAQGVGVEAPCLACHGAAIAEPVAQAIRARYPNDAATGFAEGDLRGAFWVEVPTGADAREAIPMSATQQADLKTQMRAHLASVHAILAALAAKDWPAVATAANQFAPGPRAGRPHSFRDALPEGWFAFARPMHQQFFAIASEAGGARRPEVVVAALARGTEQCVACHASFRLDGSAGVDVRQDALARAAPH